MNATGRLSTPDLRGNRQPLTQGKGELSVRELARAVGRDVKCVHEDVVMLAELGLLERTDGGGLVCPYSSMHIDMYLKAA